MKIFPLLFCLFFPFTFLQSQDEGFAVIDKFAYNYKKTKEQDATALAQALATPFNTETDKFRAIFVWITANIRYDFNLIGALRYDNADITHRPEIVLKRKLAICQGYTNLLKAMCTAVGIECIRVNGHVKRPDGISGDNGHSWTVVRTDGKWELADPTWATGHLNEHNQYVYEFNGRHFFGDPEEYIMDHFPEDPLFQLLPHPVSLKEFDQKYGQLSQTVERKKRQPAHPEFAHPQDTLDAFAPNDSTRLAAHYLAAARRVKALDSTDNKIPYLMGKGHYEQAMQSTNRFMQRWNAVGKAVSARMVSGEWIQTQKKDAELVVLRLKEAKTYFNESIQKGNDDPYVQYLVQHVEVQFGPAERNLNSILTLEKDKKATRSRN